MPLKEQCGSDVAAVEWEVDPSGFQIDGRMHAEDINDSLMHAEFLGGKQEIRPAVISNEGDHAHSVQGRVSDGRDVRVIDYYIFQNTESIIIVKIMIIGRDVHLRYESAAPEAGEIGVSSPVIQIVKVVHNVIVISASEISRAVLHIPHTLHLEGKIQY